MEWLDPRIWEIVYHWTEIIASPLIFIPLVFGLAVGYVVSLSPWVARLPRHDARAFWVYLTNILVSSSSFILTQWDKNLLAVLSMLFLVAGSSVAIPKIFFWWARRGEKRRNDER